VFESPHGHHVVIPQLAEGIGLNPTQCRIVACWRHQFVGAALPAFAGYEAESPIATEAC
jgi:hypothetical protein